jgi:hypothetical protein
MAAFIWSLFEKGMYMHVHVSNFRNLILNKNPNGKAYAHFYITKKQIRIFSEYQ